MQPREKDWQLEGLGNVIVGAGGETFQDVFRAGAGCEHEDRNVVAGGAQLIGNFETVFAGQHNVEDESVKVLVPAKQKIERSLAIAGNAGGMTFGLQIELQAGGNVNFVLDDQHAAHETLLGNSRMTVAPLPSPRSRRPLARRGVWQWSEPEKGRGRCLALARGRGWARDKTA